MTENITRQPAGIPVGGQFAPSAHAEASITLTKPPGYDPEQVAKGILNDLRDIPEGWTRELFYGTHEAVKAGKTTYPHFLDGLIARNRGGRCERHEHDSGHSPEQFCHDCHISFMVEARTNPRPLPVPRGVIPVRQENHRLEGQEISSDYDEEFRISNTTRKMTGDERFEAAVRRLFKAPADAEVEVIEQETESGTDWTRETSTELTVKCGDRKATYEYMGSFMRALDRAEQNPQAMALRFMQATSAERPLLKGIAAVYVSKGEFSDPVPVYGKIRNVFAGGSDPSMDFLHLDGRQEYLSFNRVVDILETDHSSQYIEKDSE
ncbi:hypothetical protein [Arthrobacter sp. UYCo732]|uniref:hypothetical protein n=1 Tax=Arthrobacter sp. UYCo732 TaxID=3156336 RepID=UPI003391FCB4